MPLVRFEIPQRSRQCVQGKEEFTQGMEYFSLLEGKGGAEYFRRDYCSQCWSEASCKGEIYWKSAVPVKKRINDRSLRRDERALLLLKHILDEEPHLEAEAFVLALLLVRNRILQFRQELIQENGEEVLLYEVISTEELLQVKRISMTTDQTQEVQKTLAAKLSPSDE